MSEIDVADSTKSKSKGWIGGLVALGVVLLIGWAVNRSTSNPLDGEAGAKSVCEDFVKGRLKSPGSADFSDVTTSTSGLTYTVTGAVDSQNGFGALIRSQFTCVVSDAGDEWRLQSLTGIN